MTRPAAGRILGNLDCEADFAADFAAAFGSDHRRRTLTRAALETAAGLATLLRAFARDGDRLWLPAALTPERLAQVPGLPRPELESGPFASLTASRQVLAWGETPAVASLREGSHRRQKGQPQPSSAPPAGAPLHQRLWQLPAADPAVAAGVHHRSFLLAVARRLDCALPGARMVASPAELAEHLRHDPAAAEGGRWVLKAPFSAAGRSRYFGSGDRLRSTDRRLEQLFVRHGPLLFEPWLERGEDFGLAALLGPRGAQIVGFHRSLIGPGGTYRGLELEAGPGALHGLEEIEKERLLEIFAGVVRSLEERGYRGPFGIDCWRYRRQGPPRSGTPAFHPLGEINARMTFGLVARALVDRIREPLGLDPEAIVRLRWGNQTSATKTSVADRPSIVPLLLPPAEGRPAAPRTAAWLEIRPGT